MEIGTVEAAQKKFIVIATTIVVMAAGIYLIFYAPLIRELKIKRLDCKTVENEVLKCRNIIKSAGQKKRVLITEEEVSQAIDELTRHGKMKGVNFVFMAPKETKEEKGAQYKTLPVEMKIESAYEQLAIFLGSLDDLKKALVKVKSFDINPDKKDASKLITDLVADIYLSGHKNAE